MVESRREQLSESLVFCLTAKVKNAPKAAKIFDQGGICFKRCVIDDLTMLRWLFGTTDEDSSDDEVKRRPRERVITPLVGDDLDRSLAEYAIREAQEAAMMRGEELMDNDFGDSDLDSDGPVHFPKQRRPRQEPQDDPPPLPPRKRRRRRRRQATTGNKWRNAVFTLSFLLLIVSLGVEVSRCFSDSSSWPALCSRLRRSVL